MLVEYVAWWFQIPQCSVDCYYILQCSPRGGTPDLLEAWVRIVAPLRRICDLDFRTRDAPRCALCLSNHLILEDIRRCRGCGTMCCSPCRAELDRDRSMQSPIAAEMCIGCFWDHRKLLTQHLAVSGESAPRRVCKYCCCGMCQTARRLRWNRRVRILMPAYDI